MFQAGTLYLDGRALHLCMRGRRRRQARRARRPRRRLPRLLRLHAPRRTRSQIAAAFTDGDADNLFVGRNGVFYDRKGHDWDATITKIVANPISVRQAFWAPYKKLVRLIEDQVAKRAAEADAEANAHLAKTPKPVGTVDQAKPAAKPPEPSKIDLGTVAAIGVAVGGIGALVDRAHRRRSSGSACGCRSACSRSCC